MKVKRCDDAIMRRTVLASHIRRLKIVTFNLRGDEGDVQARYLEADVQGPRESFHLAAKRQPVTSAGAQTRAE